jgi:NAD(P) transhydrogenase subunit beta
MILAGLGMAAAIIGTLFHPQIISYNFIIIGLIVGGVIGAAMSIWMPMTAMPERTALSHAFGALAAAMVGVAEYANYGGEMGRFKIGALGFEILLGCITFTGSLIAFGKLAGIVRGTPITFKGQNAFNGTLMLIMIGSFLYLIYDPSAALAFYTMMVLAFCFGVLLVIPIGAADMPVVMSLLNSYAGLAAAATGFVLSNNVLIIAGTLDGFSGFILSVLMCRAMNRSITNVLFGAFGSVSETAVGAISGTMREVSIDDVAMQLAYAKQVVFVPGYGMATAQAQYAVRELANLLGSRGVAVKFGIHPVAGRMPGHMNVLLAEANVPYDEVFELEDINSEFAQADVAFVIGANDVTNPAAEEDKTSPIYGMPVLQVWKAGTVMFIKRSLASGYAGIDNPLFYRDNTMMLLGDAKKVTENIVKAI